jgi:hypothetical protein
MKGIQFINKTLLILCSAAAKNLVVEHHFTLQPNTALKRTNLS